jgi:phage gpG-like protein
MEAKMPAKRDPKTGRFIKSEVKGLVETKKKLQQVMDDLHGPEMREGMQEATLLVSRDAKILAPVDQGPLRASITPEVRQMLTTTEGVVGSNLKYAPYMELGTGIFAGNDRVRMPPISALEGWASRHGTSARAVAWAIYKAGGLRPRKFLQNALEQNRVRIEKLIDGVVAKIVRK